MCCLLCANIYPKQPAAQASSTASSSTSHLPPHISHTSHFNRCTYFNHGTCLHRPLEKGWDEQLGLTGGRKKQAATRGPSSRPSSGRGRGRDAAGTGRGRGRGAAGTGRGAAAAAGRRSSSRDNSKEPEAEASEGSSSDSDDSSSSESGADEDSDFEASPSGEQDEASESRGDSAAGSNGTAAAAAAAGRGGLSRNSSRSGLARSGTPAGDPAAAAEQQLKDQLKQQLTHGDDKKGNIAARGGRKGGLGSSSRHGSSLKLEDDDLEVAGLTGLRRNQSGEHDEALDEQVSVQGVLLFR